MTIIFGSVCIVLHNDATTLVTCFLFYCSHIKYSTSFNKYHLFIINTMLVSWYKCTSTLNKSVLLYPLQISGDIMVLVRTPSPPPPHAKACVSRNCDTKARIKFIFDTANDDLEWKNHIDFGANRKNQNGRRRPFCENTIEGGPYRFWQKSESKQKSCILIWNGEKCDRKWFSCGHPKWPPAAILSKFPKQNKVAYRSEMARNAIESEFRTSKMADVSHFVKNFNKNY